ncbi:MAG TPA: hypothetical protein DEA80_12695 [Afipia sp.]|uniref:COG4223 family protein n=1 Tax=unclassified Afipia TaxID=2642050 RepID=UPI000464905F|nr:MULTISPECIES: hypothetical protein [unclassified Afipia]MAH70180.1 hypothetical protein [Afipia sp.]OUX60721.1 MAG: hypothetical protein CBB64_13165 [Afipia sp. TMED4]HAO42092.1 hypothetical protein [Afipia sp.]HBR45760.1 hypothetical protein [Afipia sp.]HCX16407.1 hypothetical protein [Afipia sp.]
MDDDKQDKAGTSPGSDAAKRPPPTIELTASEVSESPSAPETPDADAGAPKPDHSEQPSHPSAESAAAASSNPSRASSVFLSAVAGAVAALLAIGAATFAGWPPQPAPVSTAPLTDGIAANTADITALGTRIAKVESDAAKPAPRPVADPAIIARIDAVEKSLASLRSDLAAVRGQNEKTAAAISELRSAAPQGVMGGEAKAPAVDTAAIEERIARIERATAALSAAAAAPPAEDPKVRKLDALIHLDKAVTRGLPYATELAAARAVAGDADALRALDGFATAGLPTDDALSKELLALLPQLAPKPEPQPAPSGIVERLQQSFAKLVRIQRTDALASGPTGIVARATAAAQRGDLNEAKRELLQLPPSDRVPARPWIAKVEGRDKARAAFEQFTMETLASISK